MDNLVHKTRQTKLIIFIYSFYIHFVT